MKNMEFKTQKINKIMINSNIFVYTCINCNFFQNNKNKIKFYNDNNIRKQFACWNVNIPLFLIHTYINERTYVHICLMKERERGWIGEEERKRGI